MKKISKRFYSAILALKYYILRPTKNRQSIFSNIYKDNYWGSDESVSGVGSEMDYTIELRRGIKEIISNFDIKVIVDAPCGDFNWMRSIVESEDISYIGYDIVDDLIVKNNEQHAGEKIKFFVADICKTILADCDLLIIRDVLFHLSNEDLLSFKSILKETKFTYLLVSHHEHQNVVNTDINTGDFRELNVGIPPMNLPLDKAIMSINDSPDWYPIKRVMLLFHRDDIF